jgi:hypothetical protein
MGSPARLGPIFVRLALLVCLAASCGDSAHNLGTETGGTGGSGVAGSTGSGGANSGGGGATGGNAGRAGGGGASGSGGAAVCQAACSGFPACPSPLPQGAICPTQNVCCAGNQLMQCGMCVAETCHWVASCQPSPTGGGAGTSGTGGQGGTGGAATGQIGGACLPVGTASAQCSTTGCCTPGLCCAVSGPAICVSCTI